MISGESGRNSPEPDRNAPMKSQAYVIDCDSTESLSGENAPLLKSEDKSQSQSSLLIYFDENDAGEGTCV